MSSRKDCPAGFADKAEHVALPDQVADLETRAVPTQVGIEIDRAAVQIAFVKRNAAELAGFEPDHHARSRGQDRGSSGSHDVDRLVCSTAGTFVVERVAQGGVMHAGHRDDQLGRRRRRQRAHGVRHHV